MINKISYVATSTRQVNLSAAFNRTGIVADGTNFGGGGLDSGGSAVLVQPAWDEPDLRRHDV